MVLLPKDPWTVQTSFKDLTPVLDEQELIFSIIHNSNNSC